MYIVVACYLNVPLNIIAKFFLIRKTNRTKSVLSIEDYIDLALTSIIIFWVNIRANLGIFDGANNFQLYNPSSYNSAEFFIFNVLWLI
jgi:hypothetical protein